MGSGLDLGELRGGCRVDLGVEWRAMMVVVWVDLGMELRGFYWELGALVWMKKKRKKDAEFQRKREGVLGGSELWIALSLSWTIKRRWRRKRQEALSGGPSEWSAWWEFKFHRREQRQQQRRTTGGDGNQCPSEILLRAGRER